MKELSIEEKAKSYDEAIKKLRGFYRDYDTVSCLIDVKEELANMFPELKESDESEDEKIRKAIINVFAKHKDYESFFGASVKDILAWLEKQGQDSPVLSNSSNIGKDEQKTAWSEEDERMYRGLHNLIYSTPYCDSRKELSDWLKSLKDKYTWKPSDEQIKALNYVVNLMASSERPTENDLYYNILKSLRQQLKKLREE